MPAVLASHTRLALDFDFLVRAQIDGRAGSFRFVQIGANDGVSRPDDLIAYVHTGSHRKQYGFRATGTGQYFFRCDVNVIFPIVRGQFFPVGKNACRMAVFNNPGFEVPDCVHRQVRGFNIRLADVQVIHADPSLLGLVGIRY